MVQLTGDELSEVLDASSDVFGLVVGDLVSQLLLPGFSFAAASSVVFIAGWAAYKKTKTL